MGNHFSKYLVLIALFVYANAFGIDNIHKNLSYETDDSTNTACQMCHPVSFQGETTASAQSSVLGTIAINVSKADSYSLACLNCHDGNNAKSAPVRAPLACIIPTKMTGSVLSHNIRNHPIFVNYPYQDEGFKSSVETLPRGWKNTKSLQDILRDGKIVCISCHLPHFTKESGHLRAPMTNSILCFGCHKK